MWSLSTLFIGSIFLFIIICIIIDYKINKPIMEKRRRKFSKREVMDSKDWHKKYFMPLGLSFQASLTLTETIASVFKCHHTQFLPNDSFHKDFFINLCSPLGLDEDDEMMTLNSDLEDLLGEDTYSILARKGFPDTIGELIKVCEKYLLEKDCCSKPTN